MLYGMSYSLSENLILCRSQTFHKVGFKSVNILLPVQDVIRMAKNLGMIES